MNHQIVMQVHIEDLPFSKKVTEGEDFNEVFDVATNMADPNYSISKEEDKITFSGRRRDIHIISSNQESNEKG